MTASTIPTMVRENDQIKNLVKRYATWNEAQTAKTVVPAKRVVSGSGSMTNWTR